MLSLFHPTHSWSPVRTPTRECEFNSSRAKALRVTAASTFPAQLYIRPFVGPLHLHPYPTKLSRRQRASTHTQLATAMARKRTLLEFLYADEMMRDPTRSARGKKRKSEVEKLLESQGLPAQTIRERLRDAGLSPSPTVEDTNNDAAPKIVSDLTETECMSDNQLR